MNWTAFPWPLVYLSFIRYPSRSPPAYIDAASTSCSFFITAVVSARLGLAHSTVLIDFCKTSTRQPNRHHQRINFPPLLASFLKAPWHELIDASSPDANWHLNNLVSLSGFLHLNFLSPWGMRLKTRVLCRTSNCLVFDLYCYCTVVLARNSITAVMRMKTHLTNKSFRGVLRCCWAFH